MTLSSSSVGAPKPSPVPGEPAFVSPRSGLLLEAAMRGLERLAAKLGRTPALAPHLALGLRGEDAAFFHLRRLGYVVVARRWHSYRHPGDLDLIAWEGETLCFVEVKTRSSHDVAEAQAAVDRDKRRALRRLAWHYLRYLATPSSEARFDVLTVYFEAGKDVEFHLFRSAFGWSERRGHYRD